MEMDKSEIAVSFRLARDKKAQIKMLADLNLCSPWHIATLLDEMGELRQHDLTPDMFSNRFTPVGGTKKTKSRGQKRPRVVMDEIRAMELYEDGLDDLAMSEALGVGVCRIEEWRKRMHLKTQKRRKKAENVKKETKPAQPPEQAEQYQTATATGGPAAAPETSPLTLGEFLRLVTELTPPATLKAPLRINGALVMEIARIVIHGSRDAAPSVEIVTEVG